MISNKKKVSENIRRLLKTTSSDDLIKRGFSLLVPSKRRIMILFIFGLFIFLIHYFFLLKGSNIIKSFSELVTDINEIIIPTFAVIITGYAIFQALANGLTLITLISVNTGEKSKFEEYNLYFLGISILYLCLLVFNLLMLFIFKNIAKDWMISFLPLEVNEFLASLLITCYVLFIINVLIELKSFVYNLYSCFNINAATAAIEHLKKDNEKKNTDI